MGNSIFSIILFWEGNSLDYHEVSLISSSLSLRDQLEEAWADAWSQCDSQTEIGQKA